ncbi:hypothetical protein HG537_0F04900 [Torulaspora globosa]|uniref:Phosphodiesterase n=1 Tax=Torulaspora globosa TaxID=48254 RepID=A0A7H9HWT3_9SACH|nr:hypothetical protein HG537_0F04900 [Torulaspora sp. CBS 2947]
MSTLFVVGKINRTEVTQSLATVCDHHIQLPDLAALFIRLYSDRLVGRSHEEGVSLVVHPGNAAESAELDSTFRAFFPVLNLVAIDQHVAAERLRELVTQLPAQNKRCRDRVRRMAHWMYHSGCSSRVYSIARQLHTLRGTAQRRTVPPVLAAIDFASLLTRCDDARYWRLLSTWNFEPHTLLRSDLVWCAFVLLRKLAADAHLQLPDQRLLLFLFTLEASYHQVNKFHNFRHAVDVMQATWRLCDTILQQPLQVLLLSVAAIGHDIGHPGSNNMLLTKFRAPVAMRYQESVLENMHSDLFRQLLNDQWPQLLGQSHNTNNLISDTIKATDMALHAEYVDKLRENRKIDNLKTLTSLIIKAADISNVTRPLKISAQWAYLITLEFRDCSLLEEYKSARDDESENESEGNSDDDESARDSGDGARVEDILEVALSPEELVKKYPCIPGGQIFFIDTFAEQFFEEFCQKFPELNFLMENIRSNKKFWLGKL